MNGLIALVGSGEYLPAMEEIDSSLLASLNLNERKARVVCLPTAAGDEGDETVTKWLDMGERHFSKLGADVAALPIINRESANDPQWESQLANADLIYFSGGDPNYFYKTLQGSLAWTAVQRACQRGAIYAGCSGGAMPLAERIPSFKLFGTHEGFGVVPAKFILPHFDAFGMFRPLITVLKNNLTDGERLIGIDEDTALIGTLGGDWKVMGRGRVQVFMKKNSKEYHAGDIISL